MCLPTRYWLDTPRCGSVTCCCPVHATCDWSRKHFLLICLEVCEVSRSSGTDVCWCSSRCLWEIRLSRPVVRLDAATLPFTACEIITLLIGPDLPIKEKSDGLPQPLKAAASKLLDRFCRFGSITVSYFLFSSALAFKTLDQGLFLDCDNFVCVPFQNKRTMTSTVTCAAILLVCFLSLSAAQCKSLIVLITYHTVTRLTVQLRSGGTILKNVILGSKTGALILWLPLLALLIIA